MRLVPTPQLLVVGEVDVSAYTDKQTGETRASLEVTAHTVTFLDRKPDGVTANEAPHDSEGDEIPF